MDPVAALCRLRSGIGVMDDDQFLAVSMAFGEEDIDAFNDVLMLALKLLPSDEARMVFENALNIDYTGHTIGERRDKLLRSGKVMRSLRTLIRRENAAARHIAHSVTVLLAHRRSLVHQ